MPSAASSAGWRFLVDESQPRELTQRLRMAGHVVEDGRDVGLRGQPDTAVFAYAQAHNETIITVDKGLANIQQYPKPHAGIIASRLPQRLPLSTRVDIIMASLGTLAGQSLADAVVIIRPDRLRVRR